MWRLLRPAKVVACHVFQFPLSLEASIDILILRSQQRARRPLVWVGATFDTFSLEKILLCDYLQGNFKFKRKKAKSEGLIT